jgi:queuine tRNA-ribosyltransferase
MGCWEHEASDGAARTGQLLARDGNRLPTPLFMPVATAGSLRTLDWRDLQQLGYRHLLMNTYHLVVRPGVAAIRAAGGLKGFTGWRGSILTDSGGYQAFSLAAKRSLRPDGVHFTDHIAGDSWHFTPRAVLAAQLAFGVDFAMCLDVCTGLPATRQQVARDLALTHDWATQQAALWPELLGGGPDEAAADLASAPDLDLDLRAEMSSAPTHITPDDLGGAWPQYTEFAQPAADAAWPRLPGGGVSPLAPPRLFGIVQGGLEEDLRAQSAALIGGLPFDGVAVGGLAVGEAREDFLRLSAFCAPLLPEDRPRYLMGVGEPQDLLHAIAQGYDMFDCVQPARMARHGAVYTSQGVLALRNARYTADARPLDPACRCPVCAVHSRAYLRHLLTLKEHSYARLLTLHNLAFYQQLLANARRRIVRKSYARWWEKQCEQLGRPLPEEL